MMLDHLIDNVKCREDLLSMFDQLNEFNDSPTLLLILQELRDGKQNSCKRSDVPFITTSVRFLCLPRKLSWVVYVNTGPTIQFLDCHMYTIYTIRYIPLLTCYTYTYVYICDSHSITYKCDIDIILYSVLLFIALTILFINSFYITIIGKWRRKITCPT